MPRWRVRALARVVGPDDEVEEALAVMQRSGVAPRPGGPRRASCVGVVFLEDILEELVGEVRDVMQRDPVQRERELGRAPRRG